MDRERIIRELSKEVKDEIKRIFAEGVLETYQVKNPEFYNIKKDINTPRFIEKTELHKICAIGLVLNHKKRQLDFRYYIHPDEILKFRDDVLIGVGEQKWLE